MTEKINMNNIDGEQREIAECIGIEAYRKLVQRFGGSNIYIQKADTILKSERNNKIRKLFNGKNYKSLAIMFGLSESHIRLIV